MILQPSETVGAPPGELTAGLLVTFPRGEVRAAVRSASESLGVAEVAFASDFKESAVDFTQTKPAGMTVFESLGVAVMDLDGDQQAAAAAALATTGAIGSIATVEPEPIFYALGDPSFELTRRYLMGYRDAVEHLCEKLLGGVSEDAAAAALSFVDDASHTWGLKATGVAQTALSGSGIKVAILDTGLDFSHPAFTGRSIVSATFIPNQPAQDRHGHGTHCTGTACGPKASGQGPRSGIAWGAQIYIGKVLGDDGKALGRSTLAGIEWAVGQGCDVISMSLGAPVSAGADFLLAFEQTARAGLERGSLLVAAAGNDSKRSRGVIQPISSPANCPSVLAVGAIDGSLQIADFSNGGINFAQKVDIAAPGVDILSTWIGSTTRRLNGTSMATPHVAGIAALLKSRTPTISADNLWRTLMATAKGLPISARDVGAGLVQV